MSERKEKFSLVELAAYRGQTVNEVFRKAIDLYLEAPTGTTSAK